jgi:hypothetical protein
MKIEKVEKKPIAAKSFGVNIFAKIGERIIVIGNESNDDEE